MTTCIARLFERLVLGRLERHLLKKQPHPSSKTNRALQTKHRQTKDNFLYLIQKKSREGSSDDEKTLAVFFDVAAAFDNVWHLGLIYKLVCV